MSEVWGKQSRRNALQRCQQPEILVIGQSNHTKVGQHRTWNGTGAVFKLKLAIRTLSCCPALRTATSFSPHHTMQQPYSGFQTWTYWASWSWRSGVPPTDASTCQILEIITQWMIWEHSSMQWWQFYFKTRAHTEEITLIPFLPTPSQQFWVDHINPSSTATGLPRRLQKILFSITFRYAYKDMQIVYTHVYQSTSCINTLL